MDNMYGLISRPVAFGVVVVASAIIAGCDAPSSATTQISRVQNADGSNGVSMAPPAEWLTFRSIDPDSLQLVFTLDGEPQFSRRNASNQWTVSFTLPDNDSHVIQASWQEQLPDRTMILAESAELAVSNLQPERTVTISAYRHRDFDEDSDGISNLDERRLGLEPLVPDLVTPGNDQSDCRVNTASINFGNFFVNVTEPGFAAPLSVTSTETISNLNSATTAGRLAVFESFFVLTPGVLTVSHFGGPASTGAFLYDTDLNGALRVLGRDNIPVMGSGDTFEARRAVVSAAVQPGLYCYRVESTRVNDPLIDPALQYSFVADELASTATLPTTGPAGAARAALPGGIFLRSKE